MIKLLTALTVVVILVAMATAGMVKPKIFSTVGAAAALPTETISVDELQRRWTCARFRSRKSKTSFVAAAGDHSAISHAALAWRARISIFWPGLSSKGTRRPLPR